MRTITLPRRGIGYLQQNTYLKEVSAVRMVVDIVLTDTTKKPIRFLKTEIKIKPNEILFSSFILRSDAPFRILLSLPSAL